MGKRRWERLKKENLIQKEGEENLFSASWGQVCVWQWSGVGAHLPYRFSRSLLSLEMEPGGTWSFVGRQVLVSEVQDYCQLGRKGL